MTITDVVGAGFICLITGLVIGYKIAVYKAFMNAAISGD